MRAKLVCCTGKLGGACLVRRLSSSTGTGTHVAVVGAGPAGFYAAQHIAKARPDITIDIYDKLPVPFGLVRFGVAPDHPDVKNCITTFSKTADLPNVNFVGNTSLGQDVSLADLRRCYHSVLLTYGSAEDSMLGVPGEGLANILPARSVVSCYNGLPGSQDLRINLDTETVAVVGVGNVAIDLARMILTPIDVLRQYDTSEAWLEKLTKSRVKRVVLLGRRGPLHVSFTIAELRELIKLTGVRTLLHPDQMKPLQSLIPSIQRPKKRLMELLVKTALGPNEASVEENWRQADKEWELRLLRSPVEFLPSEKDGSAVGKAVLTVNEVTGEDVMPVVQEELECGLVLRSIGYKAVQADPQLPFNAAAGVVPNVDGRVEPGLYAAGWLGTGPRGVIVSTMNGAFKVAANLVDDLNSATGIKPGRQGLVLPNSTTWQDWLRINQVEEEAGRLQGRPRIKITSIEDMLAIIRS